MLARSCTLEQKASANVETGRGFSSSVGLGFRVLGLSGFRVQRAIDLK